MTLLPFTESKKCAILTKEFNQIFLDAAFTQAGLEGIYG